MVNIKKSGTLENSFPDHDNLFNVVDNVMKLCTEMGLGVVNSAVPVTNNMWHSGVLGEHTPPQLLDTIMLLIGVNCTLRGVMSIAI